jgi:hypothetical protein
MVLIISLPQPKAGISVSKIQGQAPREFGRVLIQQAGGPAGTIETYIEVPFDLGDKRLYPDGLIRVTRGQRSWTALVEVKTGKNELAAGQLENYLDIAREQGFDTVITISNQIPPIAGQHPTRVDKRKLKKVGLQHWSWTHVLSQAVIQKEHRGVSDPDQAWILGEMIRYLEHSRSGALEFDDMGEHWVKVRDAVASSTLRDTDKGAAAIAGRFEALLRFCCLELGKQLGDQVTPVLTRKEQLDPAVRTAALVESLTSSGLLRGAIRIPNTVGSLVVTADLRAGQITCHVDLDAPKSGRPLTRVNWLVRQLRHAPDGLRLEAFVAHARGQGTAELLGAVRSDPALLVADPKKDLRMFRIAMVAPMGPKRGRGRGAFIDSVNDSVNVFYREVLQHLKAWASAPPKMRETPEPPAEPVALVSTSVSSQDGPELVDEPDSPPAAPPSGTTVSGDQADRGPAAAEPTLPHDHQSPDAEATG